MAARATVVGAWVDSARWGRQKPGRCPDAPACLSRQCAPGRNAGSAVVCAHDAGHGWARPQSSRGVRLARDQRGRAFFARGLVLPSWRPRIAAARASVRFFVRDRLAPYSCSMLLLANFRRILPSARRFSRSQRGRVRRTSSPGSYRGRWRKCRSRGCLLSQRGSDRRDHQGFSSGWRARTLGP